MSPRAVRIRTRVCIGSLVVVPLLATILAIWFLWQRAVRWGDLALLAGLYVAVSLGITVGFHRFLTHRGFRTSAPVKALLLILGSMSLEGNPLAFAANHRKHHALSDREGDPHSPLDGLFHAHVGWLFTGQLADQQVYARDLRADRLVMVISRLYPLWVMLTLALPFAVGGWRGLLWGGLVRIFLINHVTWSVNSVCHTFGSRPLRTRDRSRNHWLVGLLALGEGWHNNHHAFPRSAVHGMEWWQFDLSGLIIRLLERTGVIWDVQRVSLRDVRVRQGRRTQNIAA